MNEEQKTELLVRLDERTEAIVEKLKALPCARCNRFFLIIDALTWRNFAVLSAFAFGAGYALDWLRKL
jgi:hypothetical protein